MHVSAPVGRMTAGDRSGTERTVVCHGAITPRHLPASAARFGPLAPNSGRSVGSWAAPGVPASRACAHTRARTRVGRLSLCRRRLSRIGGPSGPHRATQWPWSPLSAGRPPEGDWRSFGAVAKGAAGEACHPSHARAYARIGGPRRGPHTATVWPWWCIAPHRWSCAAGHSYTCM